MSLSDFIESSFSRPTPDHHYDPIRWGWAPPLIPVTTGPGFPPSWQPVLLADFETGKAGIRAARHLPDPTAETGTESLRVLYSDEW